MVEKGKEGATSSHAVIVGDRPTGSGQIENSKRLFPSIDQTKTHKLASRLELSLPHSTNKVLPVHLIKPSTHQPSQCKQTRTGI